MKITIIGSGNVAYHLAKSFKEKGLQIHQIFGRNKVALKEISEELLIPYSSTLLLDSDLYLIAVSDSAVESVSKFILNKNAIVAHTSGSLPMEILRGNYRKAVLYPLQTFSKNKKLDYSQIPIFIETENESDKDIMMALAMKISNKVEFADFVKRKYIHISAVFVCNFVNHLFAKAHEILESQLISFDYFLPLIQETVEKIHEISPKFAQTGPAIRNDKRVLMAHEELLNDHTLKIYKTMTQSIQKMYDL